MPQHTESAAAFKDALVIDDNPKESFAVFFLTFQHTLTFKTNLLGANLDAHCAPVGNAPWMERINPGYSLANRVDEYGKFLLKPAFGVLEGCFSMFVFRVNSVRKQHVGRF